MTQFKTIFKSIHGWLLTAIILLAPALALPAPKQLMTITVVGGSISLLAFLCRVFPRPKLPLPVIVFSALFLLWAYVATYLQGGDPYSYKTVCKAAALCLAGFALVAGFHALSPAHIVRIEKLFPVFFVLALVLYAFNNLTDNSVLSFFHGSADETDIADSKTNRAAVVIAVFLWHALRILSVAHKRGMAVALFLFTCAALLTGESQSALLGLVAGAIAFFMTRFKPQKVPLLLMGAVAAGLVFSPLIANPLAKAKPEFLTDMRAAAVNQRLVIWEAVTERIFEKPLAGWGVAATRTTAKDMVEDLGNYKRWGLVHHPHNMALEVWLDTGLVGVVLVLGLLWAVFNRVADCRYALALFICVIAIATVGYGMWQSWWVGLLFLVATLRPRQSYIA